LPIDQLAVSAEYFDVLGIDIVSGRAFTSAERTAEADVAIVSEPIAPQLWPNGNAVGQLVRFEATQSHPTRRSHRSDRDAEKELNSLDRYRPLQ
jgi:hypothetical protein